MADSTTDTASVQLSPNRTCSPSPARSNTAYPPHATEPPITTTAHCSAVNGQATQDRPGRPSSAAGEVPPSDAGHHRTSRQGADAPRVEIDHGARRCGGLGDTVADSLKPVVYILGRDPCGGVALSKIGMRSVRSVRGWEE